MKTLSCVCLPDRESASVIKKISQNISRECRSGNALKFIPHFTLRGDFKIPDKNISGLKEQIRRLSIGIKPFKLILNKYGFYPWRIIFLEIEKNDQLQKLHNWCLKIIEKYRTSWVPENYLNNNHFTGKQKEYSLKYGYHFCLEFFSPHFTIAGNDMTETAFQQIKEKLEKKRENIGVEVKQLAFFDRKMGNQIFFKTLLGKD
ncbi:MAG: 2'-5' RNA ligase family protein [Candidatus Pacebacteria bacterium]|nr:2'-5' RNA ligase family protein [Candidatus Paceibacterota bacterium]